MNVGLQIKENWCLCSSSVSKIPSKKANNENNYIKQGENNQRNKLKDSGHKKFNYQNLNERNENIQLNKFKSQNLNERNDNIQ